MLALVPSEHLSENEIAAAAIADQGDLFNPQQQFRVTWPAESVVARAYIDQLERSDAFSTAFVADLNAALDCVEATLEDGACDEDLAARLKSLAAALGNGRGNAVSDMRRSALAETLNGIAVGLL